MSSVTGEPTQKYMNDWPDPLYGMKIEVYASIRARLIAQIFRFLGPRLRDGSLFYPNGEYCYPGRCISNIDDFDMIVEYSRDYESGVEFRITTSFSKKEYDDTSWFIVYPKMYEGGFSEYVKDYNSDYFFRGLEPVDRGGYAPIKIGRDYILGSICFGNSGLMGISDINFDIVVSQSSKLQLEQLNLGIGFDPIYHYKDNNKVVAYLMMTDHMFPPFSKKPFLLTSLDGPMSHSVAIDSPVVDSPIDAFGFQMARTCDPIGVNGFHTPGWVCSRNAWKSYPEHIRRGLKVRPIITCDCPFYSEYVDQITQISSAIVKGNPNNKILA